MPADDAPPVTFGVKPKIDTDWNGEFLRQHVTGGQVVMRRAGGEILLSLLASGAACTLVLTPGQADNVACALASGAEIIRQSGVRDGG